MSDVQRLTGITWNHTRGFLPMVATAQRFAEIHPGIEVIWQKRSLQAFGDQPLEELAPQFDLLVIDHPFVGYAAANAVLLPLDMYLPMEFLADQAANSYLHQAGDPRTAVAELNELYSHSQEFKLSRQGDRETG